MQQSRPQIINLSDEVERIGIQSKEEEIADIRSNRNLRKWMTWFLLGQFTAANLATLTLFFLNGFGVTKLSETAIISLLGGTVAELAGIIVIIARYLFPKSALDSDK